MLLEVVSQLSLFSMPYFWLSKLLLIIKITFGYQNWFYLRNHNDYLNTLWPSFTVCAFVRGVLTYKSLVARKYFICKIWRFKNLIRTILFNNIILIYIVFYSILWNWHTQLCRRGKNQHFWHRIFRAQPMQYGTYFRVDKTLKYCEHIGTKKQFKVNIFTFWWRRVHIFFNI